MWVDEFTHFFKQKLFFLIRSIAINEHNCTPRCALLTIVNVQKIIFGFCYIFCFFIIVVYSTESNCGIDWQNFCSMLCSATWKTWTTNYDRIMRLILHLSHSHTYDWMVWAYVFLFVYYKLFNRNNYLLESLFWCVCYCCLLLFALVNPCFLYYVRNIVFCVCKYKLRARFSFHFTNIVKMIPIYT